MEEKDEFLTALVFQSGPVVEKDMSGENLSLRICDDSSIVKLFMNAALICESMEDSKAKMEVIRIVEESIRLMKSSGKVDIDAFKSVTVYPSSPSKILIPDIGNTTPLQITDEIRQLQAEVSSECREIRFTYFDRLCLLGSIFRMRCMRLDENIENEVLVPRQLPQESLPAPPSLCSPSSNFQSPIQDQTVLLNSVEFYSNDVTSCNNIVGNVESVTSTLRSHEDEDIIKHRFHLKVDQDHEVANINRHQHLLSTHTVSLNQLQLAPHPRSPLIHKNLQILEKAVALGLSICRAFLIWKYKVFFKSESSACEINKDIHSLPSLEGETFSSSPDIYISVERWNSTIGNVEVDELDNDKILEQLKDANKRIPGLSLIDDSRKNRSKKSKKEIRLGLKNIMRHGGHSGSYVSSDEVRKEADNLTPRSSVSDTVNHSALEALDEFTYDKIFKKTEHRKSGKSVKSRLWTFLCLGKKSHTGTESRSISENSLKFTGSNPLAQNGKQKIGRKISRPSSKRKNALSLPVSTKLSKT
jgi:hypothetical protein